MSLDSIWRVFITSNLRLSRTSKCRSFHFGGCSALESCPSVEAGGLSEAGLLALVHTPGVHIQVIDGEAEGLDALALAPLKLLHKIYSL
jgi:hypothetical protein